MSDPDNQAIEVAAEHKSLSQSEIKAMVGNLEPDWLKQVMEKVQEYASTYSSVGGPFDQGQTLEDAENSKKELECMLDGLKAHIEKVSSELLAVYAVEDTVPMSLLHSLVAERQRQDGKWGGPENDDKKDVRHFVKRIKSYADWSETMADMGSVAKCRRRLKQVAALAIASVQMLDRTHGEKAAETHQ